MWHGCSGHKEWPTHHGAHRQQSQTGSADKALSAAHAKIAELEAAAKEARSDGAARAKAEKEAGAKCVDGQGL